MFTNIQCLFNTVITNKDQCNRPKQSENGKLGLECLQIVQDSTSILLFNIYRSGIIKVSRQQALQMAQENKNLPEKLMAPNCSGHLISKLHIPLLHTQASRISCKCFSLANLGKLKKLIIIHY